MKNKLILVEGIPGSGKSTISKKIKEYLQTCYPNVVLFNEGDAHPADLAWCAYLPIKEYENILERYPQYCEVIKYNTVIESDFVVVSYTKLNLEPPNNDIMKYFEKFQVYDGRVALEQFTDLHLKRWESFANRASHKNTIYIFESAFFQNHICELMAIHNKDNSYIAEHLISLMNSVKVLNPTIIYLSQPDVSETITRVAKERVSSDKSKCSDWIDMVISWVEKSQYGIEHGLKGFSGAIRFLEKRKKLEFEVLEKLPIDKWIIENPNYDWEEVFKKVKKKFSVLQDKIV